MSYWGYPPYVSVGEKRARAAKKLEKLRKKNPAIAPVVIEGRAITTTWWGKSWNANLERYADYSNRIGRGRSYVRHGAVLDLQIGVGKVQALVQGTRSKPYSVTVKIQGMPLSTWKEITRVCEGQLDSLQKLLLGKFPRALGELFMARGKGIFPLPSEIAFSCSCPDSAYMCKHVAAALYGIGARLDEDPNLFFKLRKVDMHDLVSQAVQDKTKTLIEKSKKKSKRVLDDANLSDMFGIDLDDNFGADILRIKSLKKTSVARSTVKKVCVGKSMQKPKAKAQKVSPGKSKKPLVIKSGQNKIVRIAADRKTVQKLAKTTVAETVFAVVRKSRSKKGVNVEALIKKTGCEEKKIRSAIAVLKKQGRVESAHRGYYICCRLRIVN